ncbi:MAG TPA: minor capsid protein [Leptospiraceae bacterium]|nr:minor capsid protein [Leptospiraceae bacterium]HNH03076.1 minor capsid protein [Leptospiraceae bacterium]HNH57855.1 minor capsid protein [Leptospiraceae bacterium]
MRNEVDKNKYPLHIERSIQDTYRNAYKEVSEQLEKEIFEQLEKDFSLQTRDLIRQDSIFNVYSIIQNRFNIGEGIITKLASNLFDKFKILDSWTVNKIEESMNDRSKILNQVRPKQWALINGQMKQIYKPLEKIVLTTNGVKTVKYKTEELAINPNKFRNPLVQKQMDEILSQKSKEAANLIKGITDKQSDVLSNKIREAYLKGKTTDEIKEIVKKTLKVGDGRAANIGRDQTNKLAGLINSERQKKIGIKEFTWRTKKDNRVRDSHEALEGKPFDWITGAQGLLDMPSSRFPGDDPNCRCWAEPGNPTDNE